MKIDITAKLAELNHRMARDAKVSTDRAASGLRQAMQGIAGAIVAATPAFRAMSSAIDEYEESLRRAANRWTFTVQLPDAERMMNEIMCDALKREHDERKRARRRRGC